MSHLTMVDPIRGCGFEPSWPRLSGEGERTAFQYLDTDGVAYVADLARFDRKALM
ncbi:hypothetical protein SAMN05216251_108141 [Actinacidiphila alni]|uniref:Uncharacterized protein n=1 Tax=Actinacidiphila alni TaxID=380248 RepID=A0A1I2FXH5_9ACTN|nr:hypothetical protein SAMN05216251_108141 [Actinacidiphila alni]